MKPSIALYLALTSSFSSAEVSSFWQITDLHMDLTGQCSGGEDTMFGNFDNDNYGCGCSPLAVKSSMDFMTSLDAKEEKPDFIFFTGDSPWGDDLFDTHKAIKDMIVDKYPDTPHFFCLGNHDFEGSADTWEETYKKTADLWGDYLDDNAKKTFASKGYYSQKMPGGYKLLVLMTEHYNYGNDDVLQGKTYVEGYAQIDWLKEELSIARNESTPVYLFGHIPPGFENTYTNDPSQPAPGFLRPYWGDIFVRAFTDVTDEFQDVIKTIIFGHEHVDTFRLAGEKTVLFESPSMSTGYPRSNPSIRKWMHNYTDVTDYKQYYLDLPESNKKKEALWALEYQFSEAYGYGDLSRESLIDLLERFKAEHKGEFVAQGCTYPVFCFT